MGDESEWVMSENEYDCVMSGDEYEWVMIRLG